MAACCAPCAKRSSLGAGFHPEPTQADKINALRAQVNRYLGPGVPAGFGFGPKKLPVEGILDMDLAIVAALIYQRRAAEAYGDDPGMVRRGNEAIGNAIQFVGTNIDEVLATVKGYGDTHGLPAAKEPEGKHPWLGPLFLLGLAGVFLWANSKD
jgi:hypothetical protein